MAVADLRDQLQAAVGDWLAEYETGRRIDSGDASLLRSSLESEWAVGHRDSALEQAETAARLDPRDALVLSDLCEVYRGLERYAEAAQSCDRAMALQPTNRDLVRKRLWVSLERGDLADAHAVVSHALVSIDSASLAVYMAEVDEMGWLLDRALERVLLQRQGLPIADRATWMCALAQQYGYRGDTVRARAYADSARAEFAPALREMAASHRPIPPSAAAQAHVFYALALAYLGRRDSAVAQAKLAEAAAPNEWYVQITMAKVFVLVNEPDAALAILERGVAQPYAANVGLLNFVQRCTPAYLRIDPNFARLRGNPRFERLIAQPAAS